MQWELNPYNDELYIILIQKAIDKAEDITKVATYVGVDLTAKKDLIAIEYLNNIIGTTEEDGGCVFLLISDEEKEHSKIMKKYFVDKEDCEFKDILVENKGEQWISELYISATEYSITIVYKRGEKRKNV